MYLALLFISEFLRLRLFFSITTSIWHPWECAHIAFIFYDLTYFNLSKSQICCECWCICCKFNISLTLLLLCSNGHSAIHHRWDAGAFGLRIVWCYSGALTSAAQLRLLEIRNFYLLEMDYFINPGEELLQQPCHTNKPMRTCQGKCCNWHCKSHFLNLL